MSDGNPECKSSCCGPAYASIIFFSPIITPPQEKCLSLANHDSDLALYCDHVVNNYLLKSGLHGSNGHRHQLMHQLTLLCASE